MLIWLNWRSWRSILSSISLQITLTKLPVSTRAMFILQSASINSNTSALLCGQSMLSVSRSVNSRVMLLSFISRASAVTKFTLRRCPLSVQIESLQNGFPPNIMLILFLRNRCSRGVHRGCRSHESRDIDRKPIARCKRNLHLVPLHQKNQLQVWILS